MKYITYFFLYLIVFSKCNPTLRNQLYHDMTIKDSILNITLDKNKTNRLIVLNNFKNSYIKIIQNIIYEYGKYIYQEKFTKINSRYLKILLEEYQLSMEDDMKYISLIKQGDNIIFLYKISFLFYFIQNTYNSIKDLNDQLSNQIYSVTQLCQHIQSMIYIIYHILSLKVDYEKKHLQNQDSIYKSFEKYPFNLDSLIRINNYTNKTYYLFFRNGNKLQINDMDVIINDFKKFYIKNKNIYKINLNNLEKEVSKITPRFYDAKNSNIKDIYDKKTFNGFDKKIATKNGRELYIQSIKRLFKQYNNLIDLYSEVNQQFILYKSKENLKVD